MSDHETYDLFMDALDVVNRALDANRGEGAYGKVIEALDEHVEGHDSAVGVYEEDPGEPFDYFTIRYQAGRFELRERGKGDYDSLWKVPVEYLEDLVGDPESYIEEPARMDLDWLSHLIPDEIKSVLA